ncbi:MAG: cysteine synthase A [Nitrospirota bacterium]
MTPPRHTDVTELIGRTPLIRIRRAAPGSQGAAIWAKAEFCNPGGSVKDRICLNMINEAEREGRLKPGGQIIEPSSGNTGIGLALIAAVRGYRLTLVMPESMSRERVLLLESYGATVVLTPAHLGMLGAIDEAKARAAKAPDSFMPDQFSNPANPATHRKTTAPEILKALDGRIDAFVAGVGTGGTITGVGETLKNHSPRISVVAVEPAASPVLSGGKPGPHKIQGIGAGFVPPVLNRAVIDWIEKVTDDEAYQMAKRLAREEALLVGISSGANVAAAARVAQQLGPEATVVTVLPDRGDRYFSIEKYFHS